MTRRFIAIDFSISTDSIELGLSVLEVGVDLFIFYRGWSRPKIWTVSGTGIGFYCGPFSLAFHNFYVPRSGQV